MRGERDREAAKQPVGPLRQKTLDGRREERDPADRGERQHTADGEDLLRSRAEEKERRQADSLRGHDRPLEKPRDQEDAEHDAGADGRRVGAGHDDEERHGQKQNGVAPLAFDLQPSQNGQHQPRRQSDVQPGDNEQMIEAAAPVARDHSPIEIGRPAQQECRERSAHVPVERASRRRQPRVEPTVGPIENREHRGAALRDLLRALDRKSKNRPGEGHVAIGSRKVLRPKASREDQAVSAVGRRFDGSLSGNENGDFRREVFPGPGTADALGA